MLTWEDVIRAYLGSLTPEQGDRVIQAPAMCGDWYDPEGHVGCLVMTAECVNMEDEDERGAAVGRIMVRSAKGDRLALQAANAFPLLFMELGREGALRLVKQMLGEKNAVVLPAPEQEAACS